MKTTFPMMIALFYSISTLFFTSHVTRASFELDFEIGPANQSGSGNNTGGFVFDTFPGNCGVGGQNGFLCGVGGTFSGFERADLDTTPFYQGEAYIDGKWYWHMIIVDPSSGFAMESFTERALGTSFGSFSGGQAPNFGGLLLEEVSGNGWDPLGLNPARGVDFTGNGSGNPTRTVMRQIIGDGVWDAQTGTWNCDDGKFCSEFLKESLNNKPIIRQNINDATGGPKMEARFQLDMSNLSYSDDSTAGAIINTLSITDPSDSEFFRVDGNFDMATDTQAGRSEVTAGRYQYINCANPGLLGSCWEVFSIWGGTSVYKEGSYSYVDGGTDPMAYDWRTFFDPDQNTFAGGGAGSGNQEKCANGVASGRSDSCDGFGF